MKKLLILLILFNICVCNIYNVQYSKRGIFKKKILILEDVLFHQSSTFNEGQLRVVFANLTDNKLTFITCDDFISASNKSNGNVYKDCNSLIEANAQVYNQSKMPIYFFILFVIISYILFKIIKNLGLLNIVLRLFLIGLGLSIIYMLYDIAWMKSGKSFLDYFFIVFNDITKYIFLFISIFSLFTILLTLRKYSQNGSMSKNKYKRRSIPQGIKNKVWNRDGGKCVECGSNENLEFDHIIPVSKGGANTYRNIQLLCEPCNRTKSAKIG
jgi:hypothetical protein